LNVDSIRRDAPISTVTDLLEGRVPDLVVTRGSGAPGSPSRIRIRGISSINGSNDPIIIVDNVRVYSEQTSGARGDNAYSVLDNIDVNTIESIDVLKGPSASALYGSDAANGVIVIKTKHGSAGPTRWTLSTDQTRTSQPGHFRNSAYLEGVSNSGGFPGQCLPDLKPGSSCNDLRVIRYNPLSNDRTTVLGNGYYQKYNLSVAGGTPVVRYFLSAGLSADQGLLKMSDADVA
jgi:TonB-dependent SusC/RagA subfamily outer membrane receptor